METLLPKCENPECGKVDDELRAALIRSGKTDLGKQPDTRAILFCADCRAAVIALVQQVRGQVPEKVAAEAASTPV